MLILNRCQCYGRKQPVRATHRRIVPELIVRESNAQLEVVALDASRFLLTAPDT